MTHMKRLCHIRSAVVNDDLLDFSAETDSEIFLRRHFRCVLRKKFRRYVEVNESRLHHRNRKGKPAFGPKRRLNFRRNDKRRLFILLCTGHRSIALEFAKIGSVRNPDISEGRIIARRGKCIFKLLR